MSVVPVSRMAARALSCTVAPFTFAALMATIQYLRAHMQGLERASLFVFLAVSPFVRLLRKDTKHSHKAVWSWLPGSGTSCEDRAPAKPLLYTCAINFMEVWKRDRFVGVRALRDNETGMATAV